MLEGLHFLALPRAEESPRSLLARTAEANGFSSISALTSHCRAGVPPGLPSLLFGTAPLVNVLGQAAGDHRETFLGGFYRQLPGPTNRSPVLVRGTPLSPTQIRTRNHTVCPGCAREGWLPLMHDLLLVDACPTHGCLMLSHCPRCATPLRWETAGIGRCSCGHDMAAEEGAEVDCGGARTILGYLRTGRAEALPRLSKILRVLRFDEAPGPEERNRLLNRGVAIAEEEPGVLEAWFEEGRRARPGLPARAIATPWLALGDERLRAQIQAILNQASPDYPKNCGTCDCASYGLRPPEILGLLKVHPLTLAALVREGFLERVHQGGARRVSYPLVSVCRFLRLLAPGRGGTGTAPGGPPLLGEMFEATCVAKLKAIRAGDLKIIEADGRKGLRGVRTAPFRASPDYAMPPGYVGVSEAAKGLGTYADALRRVIRAGLLPVAPRLGRGTMVVLRTRDVEDFDQQFIFVGALAQRMGCGHTTLSAKLAHLGFSPVSGPTIDGALVALYRRADIESLDFAKVAGMTAYATRAGRKKGDRPLYDESQWVSVRRVSEALGVPVQGLAALRRLGLLREGVPDGREADNRRYFRAASVEAVKQWLATAMSWEETARDLDSSVASLRWRFLRSRYIQPIEIRGQKWIGVDDRERMRKHLNAFCTCAEADRWHKAPPRHFQNLVATGRIEVPSLEEVQGIASLTLLRWSDVRGMTLSLATPPRKSGPGGRRPRRSGAGGAAVYSLIPTDIEG